MARLTTGTSGEITRIVGKRTEPRLCFYASGVELKKSALFNETLQSAFPYGRVICCAKGVYRFKTQEEANQHQENYIADTMVLVNGFNKAKKERIDDQN